MLEIYFVRHGETDWNTRKILQGRQNSNLTETGILQAKKLGDKIKDIDFDKIYSSPLKRAMDTTNYILGGKKREIIPISELEEIGIGGVEGIEKEDFLEKYPIQYKDFWAFSTEYDPTIYNGESFQTLFDRIKSGLLKLISENKNGGKILVISHGVALKTIFCIIKGLGVEALSSEDIPQNTSLSIVTYSEKNGFNIKLFSDTSHL